jgi:hypothetical protein
MLVTALAGLSKTLPIPASKPAFCALTMSPAVKGHADGLTGERHSSTSD